MRHGGTASPGGKEPKAMRRIVKPEVSVAAPCASKSFTTQANPGHSSGVLTRANYDDMGDYDGYTDNTTAGIKTLQGTKVDFGDTATYTRTVSFDYRTTPGGAKVASGDFGLATVTVTSGGGASVKLQRLFSKPVLDNVINR